MKQPYQDRDKLSLHTLRTELGGISKTIEQFLAWGFTKREGDMFYKTYQPPAELEPIISPKCQEGRSALVVSYLIGTKVNPVIWKSLQVIAMARQALIVVIAHRYKNPTNLYQSIRLEEGAEYIDPTVLPYLCWENYTVNNHDILASVQINCTSINPLPQAKMFATGHTVIGHSCQSMAVKPVPGTSMPLVVWTTGTCSQIDTAKNIKAQLAQFHYKYGCILVDRDGTSRNIHISKVGQFTDLDIDWDGEDLRGGLAGSTKAVVWGDYHHGQTDMAAYGWARDITKQLQPEMLVLHDYFDGASVNPHASTNERSRLWENLSDEVNSAVQRLVVISQVFPLAKIALVESNHNDMMSRYLKKTPVSDLRKGEKSVLMGWLDCGGSPEKMLAKAANNFIKDLVDKIVVLSQDSQLEGVYLGLHGDKGVNGSKASLMQFFRNCLKCIVGHSHTPGLMGGSNQVGCLCKREAGYNYGGLSSWLHSIASQNRYDKIQHIIKFF